MNNIRKAAQAAYLETHCYGADTSKFEGWLDVQKSRGLWWGA